MQAPRQWQAQSSSRPVAQRPSGSVALWRLRIATHRTGTCVPSIPQKLSSAAHSRDALPTAVSRHCPTALEHIGQLPPGAVVADVGCYGWLLGDAAQARGVTLIGVDRREPPGRPPTARFAHGADATIDLPDDCCDLVVASHVLEHVADGVALAAELMRIVKPGGHLWIETPSELGCLAASSDDPEDHQFLSFWDDPTHVRPYSPAALYRLAISCQAIPVAMQRSQTGDVPSSTLLALKPDSMRGKPDVRYVMLKGVGYGIAAAYAAVWNPASA